MRGGLDPPSALRALGNASAALAPAEVSICEPSVPYFEHLYTSLIQTYERLKELGFTYYNGKVVVIDTEEEENHA